MNDFENIKPRDLIDTWEGSFFVMENDTETCTILCSDIVNDYDEAIYTVAYEDILRWYTVEYDQYYEEIV